MRAGGALAALVLAACGGGGGGGGDAAIGDAGRDGAGPPDAACTADCEPALDPARDRVLHDANAWLDAYGGDVAGMQAAVTGDGWYCATQVGASTCALVPGRGGGGRALRASYVPVAGGEAAVDWATLPNTGGRIGGYAPVTATIVTSYWFRISDGFVPSLVGAKWYEYWVPGGGARSQIGATALGFSSWRFHLNPNSTGNFGAQPRGPFWDDLNDGAWHRWTHLRRPNSAPGAGDGIERVWVDGTKIVDISAAAIGQTPAGGDRPWCTEADVAAISTDGIGYYWLPAYFNMPFPAAGTIDVDDFRVWQLDGAR